jgi:NAD+ synthase
MESDPMPDRFRLTLAQLNPTVGDIAGNAAMARTTWEIARAAGADFVAFTEMFITGYQVQDLVMKPAFTIDAMTAIEALARDCAEGPAIGIGGPCAEGESLYNAYWILQGGKVVARVLKHHLPNETVFDEVRLYHSGPVSGPYRIGPLRIGTPICEDAWHPDVAETLAESGAEVLLVPNGSPYYRGKFDRRLAHMVARTVETGLPLVYVNMVGAQDDQVFDGASFVLNPHGELAALYPVYDEVVAHVDFERDAEGWRAVPGEKAHVPDFWEQDYHAMVLSVRDYWRKTGFRKALLGLSGGIDSAIVATIAADALGPENVRCVMLPSEYTSPGSLADAEAVARALGCRLDHDPDLGAARRGDRRARAALRRHRTRHHRREHPVPPARASADGAVEQVRRDAADHRQQVRGRGGLCHDLRRHGGGYNPIKDLYKTRVFETCRWRNAHHRDWMMGPPGEVFPPRVIDKPPSAELRPDQKDEDSLPPMPIST